MQQTECKENFRENNTNTHKTLNTKLLNTVSTIYISTKQHIQHTNTHNNLFTFLSCRVPSPDSTWQQRTEINNVISIIDVFQ